MNNQKLAIASILLIALFLHACGPRLVKMDSQNREFLKAQSVYGIHYHPPSFIAMTSGKMAVGAFFGLIGGAVAASSMEKEGSRMVSEYQITDPALEIEEAFLSQLRADGETGSVQRVSTDYPNDDLAYLKKGFHQGSVFDFKTKSWGLGYYPTDWSHYRVGYSLRARLIRFPEGKVLWQGVCKIEENQPSGSRPKLDDLKANNGALLKTKLKGLVGDCVKQLSDQFAARGESSPKASSPEKPARIVEKKTAPPVKEGLSIKSGSEDDLALEKEPIVPQDVPPLEKSKGRGTIPPSLDVERERDVPKPFFPDKGFYFENGYGFGLLLKGGDRDVVKDSLWIDARVGYKFHKFLGAHLEGGYFISSLRGINRVVDADYFKIGPGLKFIYPFARQWAFFSDFMMGYGRAGVSDRRSGIGVSKSGFATAVDFGVTYKILHWFGLSPYLAINTISGSVNGQWATSYWFVSGAMVNFTF